MREQHEAFLKTPKTGGDFPRRTFVVPDEELEIHNKFMDKLLNGDKK
jgi:hypothetical protein